MNKACPVILRTKNGSKEILSFTHPLAGNQIVKGTIEDGEALIDACIRELEEESGLKSCSFLFLGEWDSNYNDQIWGFYLMEAEGVIPESWEHFTKDDGGHIFKFFWQPLDSQLDSNWPQLFVDAVEYIKHALTKHCI